MDITFAQLVSAYAELGILALCAIMFIVVAIFIIKNHSRQNTQESDRVDKKDDIIADSYKELLKITQEQNKALLETIQKNNETMMGEIVNKIVHHTISPEESAQQSEIDTKLRDATLRIRRTIKCQRASIIKYHNGGRGVNGQPFLKMSMTHEDLVVGVTPMISDFSGQFRNLLGYFVSEIDSKGKCFINNRDAMKEKDASMYEFMSIRNINTLYGISIKDVAGYPIGFVWLEFKNDNINLDKIDNLIKEDLEEIITLMNKKILVGS